MRWRGTSSCSSRDRVCSSRWWASRPSSSCGAARSGAPRPRSPSSPSKRPRAQVALDAPSLGRVMLLTARTPADQLPQHLAPADVVAALAGREVASPLYFREDLTPAMDVCVPAGAAAGTAVCATLDLLELQRQVQRIRIGKSGFALAFDSDGRLLAAGAPTLRAAVLTGEPIAESPLASKVARGEPAPAEFRGGLGEDVLAGWARLSEPRW